MREQRGTFARCLAMCNRQESVTAGGGSSLGAHEVKICLQLAELGLNGLRELWIASKG